MRRRTRTGIYFTGMKGDHCCGIASSTYNSVLFLLLSYNRHNSHRLGVFDGHSGSAAADFLSYRLLPNISRYTTSCRTVGMDRLPGPLKQRSRDVGCCQAPDRSQRTCSRTPSETASSKLKINSRPRISLTVRRPAQSVGPATRHVVFVWLITGLQLHSLLTVYFNTKHRCVLAAGLPLRRVVAGGQRGRLPRSARILHAGLHATSCGKVHLFPPTLLSLLWDVRCLLSSP